MALVRVELAHGAAAQALLQAVDELGQGLGQGFWMGCGLVHGQAGLQVRQRLGHEHVEGRGLEPEVGIETVGHAIETQGDQAGDVPGIAAGRGKANLNRLHLAVMLEACLRHDPEQQEAQHARAHAIVCEVGSEAVEEPRGGLPHVLVADDRLGERGLCPIDGRGNGGDERLGHAPQRLVEAEQEGLEAGCKRCTRLVDHVADAAQPQAPQERQGGLGQAQGGKRQRPQRLGLRAGGEDGDGCPASRNSMAGKCPGRAGSAGDGQPGGEAEGTQAPVEVGEQVRLAAEQVGRTGDVDEQAVGAAGLVPGGGEGGVAHGPQRQPVEGGGVGRRIGLADLQVEDLGAGVGEEVAGDKPAPSCGWVEGDDARSSLAGSDQHQRTTRIESVSRRAGGPAEELGLARPAPATGGRSATPSTKRKRCATWFHSISHAPGRPRCCPGGSAPARRAIAVRERAETVAGRRRRGDAPARGRGARAGG